MSSAIMQSAPQADTTYLAFLDEILRTGECRETRNGPTLSAFAPTPLQFNDISTQFPLLISKRIFWRGIVEELAWFLRGSTDVSELRKKGVHIWDGNTSPDYLAQRGLIYSPHTDAGPIYGFQWRHFGASYRGPHANYAGDGIDQIAAVINSIVTDPHSRRHIISAWNPPDLPAMVLPPCHMTYQFWVGHDETLQCQMYMRSCDAFLGLPFNIASTALLQSLIAASTGLRPTRLVITVGDAHIYLSHQAQVLEQLERAKQVSGIAPPTLKILRVPSGLWDLSATDVEIENYEPLGPIKAPMAA